MIDSLASLRGVLAQNVENALESAPFSLSVIGQFSANLNEPGTTIDLEGNDVWVQDILPLYGSLEDHIAQGFGFSEYVGFYGTYLVNYADGTVVDADLTYDVARDVFEDSTLTELGEGTVLYQLEFGPEATFGFEEPDMDDQTLTPLEELNFGPPADPIEFDRG